MLNRRHEMSDDLHSEVVQMIEEDVQEIVSSRSSWISTLEDVAGNYLGDTPDRYGPWDGAADYHIPMTMIAVETAHPRVYSGVVGLDEIGTFQPQDGATVEQSRQATQFLNWAMRDRTQINGLPVMDRVLHTSETYGKAITKEFWERDERVTTKLYRRPRYQEGSGVLLSIMKKLGGKQRVSPQMTEIPYATHIEKVVGKLYKVGVMTSHSDRTTIDFKFILGGEIREGFAEIPIPEKDALDIDLFITADTIIKDAPSLLHIPLPNFLSPVETNDLQSGKCNMHRYWVTYDDLARMRDEGTAWFDNETWGEIEKDHGYGYDRDVPRPGQPEPHSSAAAIESASLNKLQTAVDDKRQSEIEQGYEIIESYYRFKMPGEPFAREWVFFFMPEYRWISRVVAMEILCPTNRRPFLSWDFMLDDDESFYSMGIGHIIMDLQSVINEIFNKQMDRDDLINLPFGFYRPHSAAVKDVHEIVPGTLIPTPDPSGINFPTWNRPNAADTPYIQLLLSMVERLTSATNYFQGSSPSAPNAPRTFGATAAIIQEGQVNFGMHIMRYQDTLYHVFQDSRKLYRHFMPPNVEFMAPGANAITKVSSEVLDYSFGMIFKGNATNTNSAVKQQLSAYIYQMLMQNPLIQTNPVALFNVTRRFAIAHEYLEFDQDVAKPSPEQMHAPMDQMEEIQLMIQGQNIAPLSIDNHEQHIQEIEAFLQSEMVAEMPLEAVSMLIAHLQQHQQMAAMMQRAAMVQEPSGDANAGQVGKLGGAAASETGEPAAPSGNASQTEAGPPVL